MNIYENKFNMLVEDEPIIFELLSDDVKEILRDWIYNNFDPSGQYHKNSSYEIKHKFQRDTGIYIFNGAMKGGFLDAGYEPRDWEEQNAYYKIRPRVRAKRPRNAWRKTTQELEQRLADWKESGDRRHTRAVEGDTYERDTRY